MPRNGTGGAESEDLAREKAEQERAKGEKIGPGASEAKEGKRWKKEERESAKGPGPGASQRPTVATAPRPALTAASRRGLVPLVFLAVVAVVGTALYVSVRGKRRPSGDRRELPSPDGKAVQALAVYKGELVAGTSGGSVYKLDEAGQKWVDVGEGIRGRTLICLRSTGVGLLATFDGNKDKSYGYAVYAPEGWRRLGLDTYVVQTVQDDGVQLHIGAYGAYFVGRMGNVEEMNRGLPDGRIYINAIQVVREGVFAGLGEGLYFLRDGTDEWKRIAGLKLQDIHTLSSDAHYVFAGTTTGEVFRLMHDGSGVARANQGIPPLDIVQVLSASGTKIIAGTQRGGVWISVDEVAAWAEFNNDRTRRELCFRCRSARADSMPERNLGRCS